MTSVLLKAYSNLNLGDDLFIKIIIEKFPNIQFYLFAPKVYSEIFNYENLKIIPSDDLTRKIKNKFSQIFFNKNYLIDDLESNCDEVIYIGGSIFMETPNWKSTLNKRLNCQVRAKNIQLLGCNFGPYKSQEFLESYQLFIQDSKYVSFRDNSSYKLFDSLKQVNLSPDIVFSMDIGKYKTHTKNTVLVSTIKPSYRYEFSEEDDLKYYYWLKGEISKHIKNGKEVILLNFCLGEKDNEASSQIMKLIEQENWGQISTIDYIGNIDEIIEVIANCELIYATRFHAMILGWLFEKKVIPIVYSEKMVNVMKDLNFSGSYYDIRNNDKYISTSDEKFEIPHIVKIKAENHFKGLLSYGTGK